MAHFAITDIAGQRFEYAQKLSRAALGLAGAQGAPLRVWIDDWTLVEQPRAAVRRTGSCMPPRPATAAAGS